MFNGEKGAFASNQTALGGANQPTVVLVGSALNFSDQIIRIANVEFDGVAFERCDTVAEFKAAESGTDNIVAVILDEALSDELIGLLDDCDGKNGTCQLVLSYRDVNLASKVFETLSTRGDQCVVSYLPMLQQFDIWLSIMRLLLCGGKYIPDELVEGLAGGSSDATRSVSSDADLSELTHREREVLALVSEGKPNKTIASELELSEHTIKLHIHHVITKLGVRNRTEAAILFLGGGAIDDDWAAC